MKYLSAGNIISPAETALLAFAMLVVMSGAGVAADAGEWPEGSGVPARTVSPNGRFGVLIPGRETMDQEEDQVRNFLVDLKSHRLLGAINNAHYFSSENHRGLDVTWAPDSTWCIVTYQARFGFGSITLIRIRGNTCEQDDLGSHIQKALDGAIRSQVQDPRIICDGIAYFQAAPNGRIVARATGSTNPKRFDDQSTHYALFEGIFDPASRRWIRSKTRTIPDDSGLESVFSNLPVDSTEFESQEARLASYDACLNEVYNALRVILPAERFAALKAKQIAWIKKLDAMDSAGRKCDLIHDRIDELRRIAWE